MPKNDKLSLNSGIQTYQILTNDDEVCIPSLSIILLAVHCTQRTWRIIMNEKPPVIVDLLPVA